MTESLSDVVLYDEEAFIDDLPDAALEIAGRKLCEGPAGSVTLSFCSGYDTCPWERRL
jgi:hypothetical protein